MGFSSRLAVAAWAVGLATTAFALSSGGCARMPGLPAGEDSGTPVNADDLANDCVRTCEPDYGSAPVDCDAAEAPYEFFPEPVWDFERPENPNPPEDNAPRAKQLYAYQDETSPFLTTSATCLSAAAGCDPSEYEPKTYPTDRCGRDGHALHVRGGPFRDWGGGVGRRLDGFAKDAATKVNVPCPEPLPLRTDGTCASLMPVPPPEGEPPPAEPPAFCAEFEARIECAPGRTLGETQLADIRPEYYGMIVDLREWEGISFWARRGPDSQPSMRVAVGDRNSDDDISFLETEGGISPLRCERVKECGCPNHKPCRRHTDGVWYCWDPATDPPPPQTYPLCGHSACDEPYAAFGRVDPAFSSPENSSTRVRGTAECTYYAFSNDQSGEYCFDPKGAPPAEPNEQCGDPWNVPVRLNPDWTFYAIPFTELHQDGYAKEYPALDLAGVTMVRFLWGGGWVDYWIDDVRFYRKKK
jgi:hypothetical protein